ncbi:T9SS type A sorting domain-containing protein [bacterium SCSIO 12741]|nr:T9SS type A sorting domain-containing protein [bacterium SCSIO 12741]
MILKSISGLIVGVLLISSVQLFAQSVPVSGGYQAFKFQIDQVIGGMSNAAERVRITTTLAVEDGYLILGNVEKPNSSNMIVTTVFIAHVDHHGRIPNSNYWVKTYGDSITNQLGHQIIRDYYGNYVVLGEEEDPFQPPSKRIWLFTVDLAGTMSNSKLFNLHVPQGYCSIRGMEIVPTLESSGPSGYAICGFIFDCTMQSNYPFAMRLDNNLGVVWSKYYNQTNAKFLSIAQKKGLGENLIVVGTDGDGIMAELNYANGNLVVNSNINSSGNFYTTGVRSCNKVISTWDGGFVIGSSIGYYSTSSGVMDEFGLHKFDQNGVREWFSEYDEFSSSYHDYLTLEDIREHDDEFEVLLSSNKGLIISRANKFTGSASTSMLYTTGGTSTKFWREVESDVKYQKLSFDPGSIIREGTAVATHFSGNTPLGGIPTTNDRKEFRLIKTDTDLETGATSCQSSILIVNDPHCSQNPAGPCRKFLANAGMVSTNNAGISGGNFNHSVFNGSATPHYYCSEVVYEVFLPEPNDDNQFYPPKRTTGINDLEAGKVDFLVKTISLSGIYNIESSLKYSRLQVLDINGRIVLDTMEQMDQIDISQEEGGVYVVRAVFGSNTVVSSKIVKQ